MSVKVFSIMCGLLCLAFVAAGFKGTAPVALFAVAFEESHPDSREASATGCTAKQFQKIAPFQYPNCRLVVFNRVVASTKL